MRNLVIQVPGMGVATLWLAASVTDRVVTLRDQADGKSAGGRPGAQLAGPLKLSKDSFAKRLLCAIVVLAAGCAPMTAGSRGWVTRDGSALADPADYADCLLKAQDVESSASVDGKLPIYGLPRTDLTLFSVCMDAHGYRPRGAQPTNARS